LDSKSQTVISRVPAALAHHDWAGVYPRILSYFVHRRRAEADDLAQETFARALKWLSCEGNTIKGPDGFVKFVYGCARNVLLEQYKRERDQAQRQIPMDEMKESPRLQTTDHDDLLAMREAFSRLPEEDRICLVRAELESGQKVANDMRISLKTLRVRVFRARQRLRELLNESPPPNVDRNLPLESVIGRLGSGVPNG
jgi:RNA polymerase sigma factor (sigma-70 family)